jgi:hypothetical protein
VSSAKHSSLHEETWLLLPWLANDRISDVERERAEEHVRLCDECTRELAAQRALCDALSVPERVTYAPGPSFRKLLERIDGPGAQAPRGGESAAPRGEAIALRGRSKARPGNSALWRPPGLAWAASFLAMVAMTAMVAVAYHWSEARYGTVLDRSAAHPPQVLQIAFVRDLTIGGVEELLRADGARVVEGPGTTGIFGVAPVAHAGDLNQQLRLLATRLRADPRVRWVQPIDMDETTPEKSPGRGP